MRVCLISNNNGWGLTNDILLLTDLLRKTGHEVKFQQWNVSGTNPGKFHLNIHLELVGRRHLRNARYNWVVPNQEWFQTEWLTRKAYFDKVLCKTHHATEVFNALGFANVKYSGFSTADIYMPDVPRVFECIHVAGNSIYKGTQEVLDAWTQNPQWPMLHLYNSWAHLNINLKNVTYHFGRVPTDTLRKMQNRCIYHIQPSHAEGFGHVIYEGLAVGAIVLTTAAPPMSEIPSTITVPANKFGTWGYGTLYKPTVIDLISSINEMFNLDHDAIKTKQQQARQSYITNHRKFEETFYGFINEVPR